MAFTAPYHCNRCGFVSAVLGSYGCPYCDANVGQPSTTEQKTWQQSTPTKSGSEVSDSHGISNRIQDLHTAILVLHSQCAGLCSELLTSSLQNIGTDDMQKLRSVSASFVNLKTQTDRLVTIVQVAEMYQKYQTTFMSTNKP